MATRVPYKTDREHWADEARWRRQHGGVEVLALLVGMFGDDSLAPRHLTLLQGGRANEKLPVLKPGGGRP